MRKLEFKKKIKLLQVSKLKSYKLDNKTINLIDVKYNPGKAFEKISKKSNIFIKNSFDLAFQIIKKNNIHTNRSFYFCCYMFYYIQCFSL